MPHEFPEQFQPPAESVEALAAKEQAISALNEKGIDSTEARELLGRYADLCHAEADREASLAPGDPDASNRANIRAEIRIALLWTEVTAESATEVAGAEGLETAWDLLEQIRQGAGQNPATADLVQEIDGHLDRISSQQS